MTDTAISIQLTGPQIDRVIRESGEGPGIASLLRGMAGDGTMTSRYEALAENPGCRARCSWACSSWPPSPARANRWRSAT